MARGTIVIDRERCKGCLLCRVWCPKERIDVSDTLNDEGYLPAEFTPVDGPESCNGCALCALVCPDLAITVYREDRKPAEGGA